MATFDESRAWLKGPDFFPRFRAPAQGQPLASLGLALDEELLIVERGGLRRGFLVRQAGWHHVIQGELALQPYVVSF
ncbi:MAG: hypothetical protein KDK70_06225 [Myxococcales bacterium]|nr:hypothetical protein [Myxococcales bacterium]